MANCKYCTNYFLNCNNRVDSSCMGNSDIRKSYFSCNEKLNPNKEVREKEMIKELQKRGYKVTK